MTVEIEAWLRVLLNGGKGDAPLKTNYFVADSSLYSKSYLLNHSHHTLWIRRVPERVKKAKRYLEMGHKGTGWIKLKGGQKYFPIKTEYCGYI